MTSYKKDTAGFTYFNFVPIWFHSCSPLDSYSRLMLPITPTRGLERDGLWCLPWKSESGARALKSHPRYEFHFESEKRWLPCSGTVSIAIWSASFLAWVAKRNNNNTTNFSFSCFLILKWKRLHHSWCGLLTNYWLCNPTSCVTHRRETAMKTEDDHLSQWRRCDVKWRWTNGWCQIIKQDSERTSQLWEGWRSPLVLVPERETTCVGANEVALWPLGYTRNLLLCGQSNYFGIFYFFLTVSLTKSV